MDIVKRFRPGGAMRRFRGDVDDLFHHFFEDWPVALLSEGQWPPIEVGEEKDKVVVRAELPGVSAGDIELSVMDNALTITGEKKSTHEENTDSCYCSERRYGSFRRTIALPASVDADKVDAHFNNGILTVELPKDQASRPRRIEVKT
jgi:HSP20 family protein